MNTVRNYLFLFVGCVLFHILGTWNLLKATARTDYQVFVNTGSSSEYGFKDYAMRETDVLEPNSYYAVSKCARAASAAAACSACSPAASP